MNTPTDVVDDYSDTYSIGRLWIQKNFIKILQLLSQYQYHEYNSNKKVMQRWHYSCNKNYT